MEKLFAVASLADKMYGRWLFQRLLSRIIALLGLVIVTAILISGLLFYIVYIAHYTLVSYGVGMLGSLGIPLILTVCIIVLAVFLTLRYLGALNRLPNDFVKQTANIVEAFPAFWQGFTATPKEQL